MKLKLIKFTGYNSLALSLFIYAHIKNKQLFVSVILLLAVIASAIFLPDILKLLLSRAAFNAVLVLNNSGVQLLLVHKAPIKPTLVSAYPTVKLPLDISKPVSVLKNNGRAMYH